LSYDVDRFTKLREKVMII